MAYGDFLGVIHIRMETSVQMNEVQLVSLP